MVRHFVAVQIIWCVLCVKYLQLMKCYIAAMLQHLTAAECCNKAFSTLFIPLYNILFLLLDTL